MERKLLTLTLLVLSISGALAIRCYMCGQDGTCLNRELGTLTTCPSITGFVSNQCSKFDGAVSGSVGDTQISVEGLVRSCQLWPVNTTINPPPNRCFSGNDATQYVRNLIEQASGGAPITGDLKVTISGDLCFCNEDGCNGVASIQPLLALISALAIVQAFM